MNIVATLNVEGRKEDLKRLFASEFDGIKTDRASFKIKDVKLKNVFCIIISADDSTSFRAITNSISKLLTIYEKTDEVIKNEN